MRHLPGWVRRLGAVAGCAAVAALLMLAARGVHWPDVWRLARTANPAWLALAVALNCAVLLLWSAAWQRFLPPARRPPLRRVFDVVATAAMLMNTAPFGVGHATAFVLLTRRAGASAGSAARVLALDQLAEGAAKLALVLLAALLVPLPGWLRGGVIAAAGVVGAVGVALAVAGRAGPHPARLGAPPSPPRRGEAAEGGQGDRGTGVELPLSGGDLHPFCHPEHSEGSAVSGMLPRQTYRSFGRKLPQEDTDATLCHPERSEGSAVPARGNCRSFVASLLRMTAGRGEQGPRGSTAGSWQLIPGFLLILGIKVAEVGATLAVQRALGLDLPVGAAVLSLAAVQLATALPLTPGSVGQYEAAAMLAYRHLGIPAETALGLAVVQHLCLLLPLVGTGAVLVLARGVISVWWPAPAREAAS